MEKSTILFHDHSKHQIAFDLAKIKSPEVYRDKVLFELEGISSKFALPLDSVHEGFLIKNVIENGYIPFESDEFHEWIYILKHYGILSLEYRDTPEKCYIAALVNELPNLYY